MSCSSANSLTVRNPEHVGGDGSVQKHVGPQRRDEDVIRPQDGAREGDAALAEDFDVGVLVRGHVAGDDDVAAGDTEVDVFDLVEARGTRGQVAGDGRGIAALLAKVGDEDAAGAGLVGVAQNIAANGRGDA